MSEVCGDNRFELIGEFKGKLVEGTNIETSPEEMAVLDNILFRFWQMGWLDKLKAQEPRVMTSAEVEAWLMIGRVDRTPIVIEVRDKFIAWVVGDEYYDLPECDLSGEFYNKTWRCWTSRPTDEQREATPWED